MTRTNAFPFHALALSAVALLASASARADYRFTYTSFDAPGGSLTGVYTGSGALGLSNSGAIVGLTTTDAVTYDGYLRRPDGSYMTLNYNAKTKAGDFNSPRAINNAGIVTGFYDAPNGDETRYIYDSNAKTFSSPLHPNPTTPTLTYYDTYYQGINDAGQVAAPYMTAPNVFHSSIYDVNTGDFTNLDDVPASLGTDTTVQAVAVNGDYVANYTDSAGNVQGSVHRNGGYTSLKFPGADSTRADAINSHGLIAGRYFTGASNEGAFLYDNGTFYDIAFPGAIVTDVEFGFNDSNQIAGYYIDQNLVIHSFLAQATDVPEPSACALLIAGGLTGTAFLRRRSRKGRAIR